ncbi:hypothetical protein H8B09_19630 [Paenibacillus sp. PR3]|uniref:Uncharacterized protein n=1 Tax=Paenibacillus terricola TaxID=2763503 RepID=A0ABR8MYF6_9BACL|nr:hypothetical protein [Paenibacillus terricola]MBD3920987.1 hypothetical protein [Paenibacillus terricola]
MKRFEPETYNHFHEAMKVNAEDGMSILLRFAKQIPNHPDWFKIYKEELKQSQSLLDYKS